MASSHSTHNNRGTKLFLNFPQNISPREERGLELAQELANLDHF